jgi:hypothetical protein
MEAEWDSPADEIAFKYRASAESTCLKGPTSVKDHKSSVVAVQNQHKTIDKSYDCKLKKFPLIVIEVCGLYR